MSYAPCTYLQATEVDYSPTSFLDTNQLSLLSGMDMPAKSSENEQQTDGFQACECGKEMLGCSIHPSTPEAWTKLMSSMLDSLVQTFQSQGISSDWEREQEAASTVKSFALQALFDPNTSSWKTSQQSLVTDLEQSLETWPRWGWTVGGSAYAHRMSGRSITETDGFYWLTPTTMEMASPGKGKAYLTETGTVRRKNQNGTSSALGLSHQVKYWPTPNASDCRDRGNMSMPSIQRRAAIGKQLNLSMVVHPTSGQLNPTWVEWLMGFPIGFTVSKDWVTPKSRCKPQQPTDCSEAAE